MRRKVIFQRRSTTQSSNGQLSEVWVDIYTTSGTVKQTGSTKTTNEEYEVSSSDAELTVPYSAKALTLATNDTVTIGGVRFLIKGIDTNSNWRKSVKLLLTQRNEV